MRDGRGRPSPMLAMMTGEDARRYIEKSMPARMTGEDARRYIESR